MPQKPHDQDRHPADHGSPRRNWNQYQGEPTRWKGNFVRQPALPGDTWLELAGEFDWDLGVVTGKENSLIDYRSGQACRRVDCDESGTTDAEQDRGALLQLP